MWNLLKSMNFIQITWCVRNTPSNSFDTINITVAGVNIRLNSQPKHLLRVIFKQNMTKLAQVVKRCLKFPNFWLASPRGTIFNGASGGWKCFFWKNTRNLGRVLGPDAFKKFQNRWFWFQNEVSAPFSLFLISFGSREDL